MQYTDNKQKDTEIQRERETKSTGITFEFSTYEK